MVLTHMGKCSKIYVSDRKDEIGTLFKVEVNMIKFKNGSQIEGIDFIKSARSSRSKVITIGKPKIRDLWLDFWLKIKKIFR